MTWNTVRAALLPPRWRGVEVEQAVERRSLGGQPVRVIGVERDETAVAEPVRLAPVRAALEARGFTEREPIRNGASLHRHDVQAELFEEDGELADVLLTFTLSRDSPRQWPAWQQLVDGLSAEFRLHLEDRDSLRPVPTGDLFRLLSRMGQWREFRDHFHWPEPPARPVDPTVPAAS
jgi:hypothetical protein